MKFSAISILVTGSLVSSAVQSAENCTSQSYEYEAVISAAAKPNMTAADRQRVLNLVENLSSANVFERMSARSKIAKLNSDASLVVASLLRTHLYESALEALQIMKGNAAPALFSIATSFEDYNESAVEITADVLSNLSHWQNSKETIYALAFLQNSRKQNPYFWDKSKPERQKLAARIDAFLPSIQNDIAKELLVSNYTIIQGWNGPSSVSSTPAEDKVQLTGLISEDFQDEFAIQAQKTLYGVKSMPLNRTNELVRFIEKRKLSPAARSELLKVYATTNGKYREDFNRAIEIAVSGITTDFTRSPTREEIQTVVDLIDLDTLDSNEREGLPLYARAKLAAMLTHPKFTTLNDEESAKMMKAEFSQKSAAYSPMHIAGDFISTLPERTSSGIPQLKVIRDHIQELANSDRIDGKTYEWTDGYYESHDVKALNSWGYQRTIKQTQPAQLGSFAPRSKELKEQTLRALNALESSRLTDSEKSEQKAILNEILSSLSVLIAK